MTFNPHLPNSESTPSQLPAASTATAGISYGLAAYGIWGLVPLYVIMLAPAGLVEILADRVVFSLLACFLLITGRRSWRFLGVVLRNGRLLGLLTLGAVFFAANWLTFTYAILAGQAIDASLGSFLNPVVTALIGVFVLKEKLRPFQWVAFGIGLLAVVMFIVVYGHIPWVALLIALSWCFYGLVKSRAGTVVDPVTSLTVETMILTPVALMALVWLALTGALTLNKFGAGHFFLLAAGGLVTATPLIFFGAATRRLPVTTTGLLQYVSPLLMFIIAVTVLGEHMGAERWVGFAIIWLALSVLTVDILLAARGKATRAQPKDAMQQAFGSHNSGM